MTASNMTLNRCSPVGNVGISISAKTIFVTTLFFMSVFGSFGNTLGLYCLSKFKNRNTCGHQIHFILIIFDSIVCFIVIPFQGMRLIYQEEFAKSCFLQRIRFHISIIPLFVSVIPICGLAIERYFFIVKYQIYNTIITRNRVKFLFITTFTIGFVTPFLSYLEAKILFFVALVLFLIPPLIVLPLFYALIIRELKRKQKALNRNRANRVTPAANQENEASLKRYKKVGKRCLPLIVCCWCCLLPAIVVHFISAKYGNVRLVQGISQMIAFIWWSMNSCLNPVLYIANDSRFLKVLRRH